MRGWVPVLLSCAACGRIGFGPISDARDDDALVAVDAPLPAGPFGDPVLVDELNTTSAEDDISLTSDLLEIYFMSSRTGSNRLHRATRTSRTDPWSPPDEVVDFGTDVNNPRISNDGLSIYFSSGRTPNLGMADVWFASRADRSAAWLPPQPMPGINTASNEIEPWLLDSQLVMYLTISGSGIVRSERGATSDPFGAPMTVEPLGAPGYEGTAWVDESERLVLFHSDRGPDRELFYSTRASTSDAWAAPLPMTELNSTSSDADAWMSPDRHVIFFVSTRNGNYDVFMATR